jgi:GntR family transcriptional repressor for pyruvate dehydrogenase complex
VFRTLYDYIIEGTERSMPKARSSNWPSPTVQTLPDQVAEAILQRIATGELQPGHRLPAQRELAQSMGVGLAVIREAVQRLATLNIIEATHGSGTIIRPFRWLPLLYDKSLFHLAMQRIGIHDLWEARRLLEGQIIRLAVQRRTELDLERMRAVLDAAKPLPTTYGQSQALNLNFHRALAQAGQNAVLADLLDPLLDVQSEGASHRFSNEHCRKTWEAHEAIYRAVLRRDMAAAEQSIDRHFKIGPIALDEIEARGRVARPAKSRAKRRRGT